MEGLNVVSSLVKVVGNVEAIREFMEVLDKEDGIIRDGIEFGLVAEFVPFSSVNLMGREEIL